jgi:hypothetical protein
MAHVGPSLYSGQKAHLRKTARGVLHAILRGRLIGAGEVRLFESGQEGFRGNAGTAARQLKVAAARDRVGMGQRRDPGPALIGDAVAGGAELVADAAHVHGIPDQHCIRDQTEATGLVHDFLAVANMGVTLVGKEYPIGEDLAELAAVDLHLDRLPQLLVMDVAQDYVEYGRKSKS